MDIKIGSCTPQIYTRLYNNLNKVVKNVISSGNFKYAFTVKSLLI